MKKIDFIRVDIEGFSSILNCSFDLETRKGITIIKGDNGVGKSTLLASIAWVLYGVNLKLSKAANVETWQWLRPNDYKGTRVVLHLNVDGRPIQIARTLNYEGSTFNQKAKNSIFIYDQALLNYVDKKETQKAIDTLLSTDSKTFLNSVLFGQRMQKFIDSDNEDKRKIFESLFDIDFIDACKERALAIITDLQKSGYGVTNQIQQIKFQIQTKQEEKANYLLISEGFERDKKSEISKLMEQIELQTEAINNIILNLLPEVVVDNSLLEQRKQEIDFLKGLINEKSYKIQTLGEVHTNLKKTLENPVCGSCGQPISDLTATQVSIKVIAGDIETLSLEVLQDQQLLEPTKVQYEELLKKQTTSIENSKIRQTQKHQISTAQNAVNSMSAQIEVTRNRQLNNIDIEGIDNLILTLNQTLQKAELNYTEIETKIAKYNWWNSQAFGAGGLKIFIIQSMLVTLNKLIHNYSSKFGIGVALEYDLTKNRKTLEVTVFRDTFKIDYKDLSGGQKARVDISIAFAIHDMLSSTKAKFNVLFLDEFFEGMDEKGMYEVFELLREKSENSNIFLITHNNSLDIRNTNSVFVTGEDGITKFD